MCTFIAAPMILPVMSFSSNSPLLTLFLCVSKILGVRLVILPNNNSYIHCGFRIEVNEFKADEVRIAVQDAGFHLDANSFARFMNRQLVGLVVFAEGFFRLHPEATAADLPQHSHFFALGLEDDDLRIAGNIHSLKSSPLCGSMFLSCVSGHWTFSLNGLTGSISTGTSWMPCNADFSSDGMESYFLNQSSARFLSPVASISSSSLAKAAIAAGIFE